MAKKTKTETETKTKTKTKVKKQKIEGEPKKNKSSYMFFCLDERQNIKTEKPDLANKEIIVELAARWRKLQENKHVLEEEEDERRNEEQDEMIRRRRGAEWRGAELSRAEQTLCAKEPG